MIVLIEFSMAPIISNDYLHGFYDTDDLARFWIIQGTLIGVTQELVVNYQ